MVKLDMLLDPGPQGNYAFYGGDLMKGTVVLTSDEAYKARGLYVKASGKAKTHWSSGSGKSRSEREGEEILINSKMYLFGQRNGPKLEIQPGVRKYGFVFSLPHQLPYSFDATHGEIRYYIKCVLDIPWGFDEEVRIPFVVISFLDLNLRDHLKVPRNYEFNETFFTFSNDSGPLKMVVSLPFTGFISGQEVPLKINYVNDSSIDVERTKVKLKQRTSLSTTSKSHTKVTGQNYSLLYLQGVKAHSAESITAKFQIPQVMASNEFCEIITIRYYLKVIAEVSGFHNNMKMSIPITIGDVGLGTNHQPAVEFHTPSAPTMPRNDADLHPTFEVPVNIPRMENSNG